MINKEELFALPAKERKQLAVDLLNSIDEELADQIPEWKKELIKERLQYHETHSGEGIEWNEWKKKYEQ